jgi:ataxia telangiectasia mutated family protein
MLQLIFLLYTTDAYSSDLLAYFSAVDRGSQAQRYVSLMKSPSPCSDNIAHQTRNPFDDKSYHSLYEAIFRCILLEKEGYFSSKKTARSVANAAARLEKCAEALRRAVRHGATKIKRKTAKAIIDHITQVLLGPEDTFIAPLLKDYVKTLVTFLSFPANVEHLTAVSSESWDTCVDFCVDALPLP